MLKICFLFLTFFSLYTSATETVLDIIALHNRPASELQPLITPLLEGSEHIVANHSNLIIKATPARIKELKKLINALDTRLTNLIITVVQSRTKTATTLNADANIRLYNSLFHPSKLSAKISGRYANTNTLNNQDSTQVIKTLEGTTAFIKAGENHPVHHISVYDSEFEYPSVYSNTQYIEISTGFKVTPHLTGNQVTMDILPWSDNINLKDTIDTQSANTRIRVNLGEWVEIGRINDQQKTTRRGTFSHNYSTENNIMRILIKVEKYM